MNMRGCKLKSYTQVSPRSTAQTNRETLETSKDLEMKLMNRTHDRAHKAKILYSWGNQSRSFSFVCSFNDYHAQSTQNRGKQSQALLRSRAL